MTSMLRRCVALTAATVVGAAVLLAVGVPGGLLLGLAPALICVGMHLVMGHGHPTGATNDHARYSDPATPERA